MSVALLLADVGALLTSTAIHPAPAQLLLGVLVVGAYQAMALYRTRLTLSLLDDVPRLLCGVVLAATATTSVAAVHGHGDDSALPILEHALLIGVLVITFRTGAYAAARRGRALGWFTYRTVVVGTRDVGVRLGRALCDQREYGLRLAGFVDDDPVDVDLLPAPVLGKHADLAEVAVRHRVSVVIVAFGGVPAHELVATLRACAAVDCEIFMVPRLFELHSIRHVDRIRAVPLVRLPRPAFRSPSWRVKRGFDIVVAGLAVTMLSPILLATAVAVRLEGGPGVLFRQQRIGLAGHEFTMYKLRSLTPRDSQESRTRWTVAGDDRMGPVGTFIRRTSIDELPQLFNVLRGDMSLVGPRPERPYFVTQFSDAITSYAARHRVPAGLTGWAAVSGLRGDTSIEERAYFDNLYIDNWSLWLDVKILLRTLTAVLRGEGA